MAQTCVSRNLAVDAGVLGVEPWSVPRMVVDVTVASTGDGAYGQQTTLPGKTMIDTVQTWVSDSPLPTMVLLRINRAYHDFVVSNPNAVQVRDRWSHRISAAGLAPVDPDPSTLVNGQFGGALDLSSNSTATPISGRLWHAQDAAMVEDYLGPIPAGETLKVAYRAILWTPPPFADNANNNSPTHDASVRNVRIQFLTLPQQDVDVVIG